MMWAEVTSSSKCREISSFKEELKNKVLCKSNKTDRTVYKGSEERSNRKIASNSTTLFITSFIRLLTFVLNNPVSSVGLKLLALRLRVTSSTDGTSQVPLHLL